MRKEKLEFIDINNNHLFVDDIIFLYNMIGTVKKCHGTYGIAFNDNIDWNLLINNIPEETGCNNSGNFCLCDTFISFWELTWNYNIEDNLLPMINKIVKTTDFFNISKQDAEKNNGYETKEEAKILDFGEEHYFFNTLEGLRKDYYSKNCQDYVKDKKYKIFLFELVANNSNNNKYCMVFK